MHINGKTHFVYSWRLEPAAPQPVGTEPDLFLREKEKLIGYDLDNQLDPLGKNITVNELVERYLSTKTGAKNRAVFDIVCDLRKQKNGDKFIQLYDKRDFSECGSQSEADVALCALIAFRIGAAPEAIDEMFRSSALYRDKWERADYRIST